VHNMLGGFNAWAGLGYEVAPVDGGLDIAGGGWKEQGERLEIEILFSNPVGEVTYQWMRDGVDLPDETGSVYVVDSLAFGDSGSYSARVADEGKALYIAGPVAVTVYAAGSLPAAGVAGVCVAALACATGGAFALRRKRLPQA